MRLQPAIAETAPETFATHLARAGDEAGAAEDGKKPDSSRYKELRRPRGDRRLPNALQHMSKQDRGSSSTTMGHRSAYFTAGDHDLNRKHLAEAAAAAEAGGDPVTEATEIEQERDVLSQLAMMPSTRFTSAARLSKWPIASRMKPSLMACVSLWGMPAG